MTIERDSDSDATAKMPRVTAEAGDELENIDPERTLVRDDWESIVIRRVARHVAAVQSEVAGDPAGETRFGWESEGMRRLVDEVRKTGR